MPRIECVETFVPRLQGREVGYWDSDLAQRDAGDTSLRNVALAVFERNLIACDIESLMVRVTADDGTVGWGEAQIPIGPRVAKALVDELFLPLLLGHDALATTVAWETLYSALHDRGHTASFVLDAISAVDTALWDLKGHLLGQSVSQLLGGAYRPLIPTVRFDGSPEDPPERLVALAVDAQERGFTAVKYWLGRGVESDAAVARAVRAAVGPALDITVYGHEAYSVEQALALGRQLEQVGGCGLQIPIDHEDVAGLQRLSTALDLRVSDGECRRGRQALLPLLLGPAVDLLQVDAGRAGGITETRRIFDCADAFHVPYGIHGGTGLGPYLAANLHVAAAARNFTWIDYSDALHTAANVVLRRPIAWREGAYVVPEGPGLGIEVDEERVHALSGTGNAR